jgi:hypothetical protein
LVALSLLLAVVGVAVAVGLRRKGKSAPSNELPMVVTPDQQLEQLWCGAAAERCAAGAHVGVRADLGAR